MPYLYIQRLKYSCCHCCCNGSATYHKNEPERIERLWKVTNYALKRFKEEGFEIGDTESPIIPLYVRNVDKTFLVTKLAFDAGVFINPVIPPACAPQDTLVRFALMATHTKEQVERGVQALKKYSKNRELSNNCRKICILDENNVPLHSQNGKVRFSGCSAAR